MMLAGSSAAALLWHTPAFAQGAAARPRDTDWLHYANDASSTRYSPLDQINAANFNQLELAWRFSTNARGPRPDADYQSTPLVVKGRIYVTAGFRRDVVCLDAGTGELLWMHTYDEGQRLGSDLVGNGDASRTPGWRGRDLVGGHECPLSVPAQLTSANRMYRYMSDTPDDRGTIRSD